MFFVMLWCTIWQSNLMYIKIGGHQTHLTEFLFLCKVYITLPLREDVSWREGELLCAQATFAPILLQKMQQVDEQGRLAMVNNKVNTTKEIMRENIELALKNDEALDALKNQSEELNVMAKQFKKRSKDIKKFKMWQNAKHGIMIGTAVTVATAVIVVPPLVALL